MKTQFVGSCAWYDDEQLLLALSLGAQIKGRHVDYKGKKTHPNSLQFRDIKPKLPSRKQ